MLAPLQMIITGIADVEQARRVTRTLATSVGFGRTDGEVIVLAVSELTMNLVRYGRGGQLVLTVCGDAHAPGIEVCCADLGPGIPDLPLALQDGYSTGGGLGAGLPAVRRLMDDFDIASGLEGTKVVARKWVRSRS